MSGRAWTTGQADGRTRFGLLAGSPVSTLTPMNAVHLFTLANVPVRASLGYLLLAGYFAYLHSRLGVAYAAVAVLCLTLSLLVHEFGHALVARRLRLEPQVVLHGWGGLCAHLRAESNRHDAWIIAAGPGAGLLFGALVWVGAQVLTAAAPEVLVERHLFAFTLQTLIYINIYWSLLNLVPLWPLDGGQLFRLGALRYLPPARAERVTHITGAALGVVGAIISFAVLNSIFLGIITVLLAFENIRRINERAASGPIRTRNTHADELLRQSTEALASGEPHEARRLAFQVKDLGGLAPPQLDAAWALLAVSSARLEAWQDALDYSLRAPRVAPVFAARVEALAHLGRTDEARRELADPDAPALPPAGRAQLEALLS